MGVPPGNRPAVPRDWSRGVPEWYDAGAYTRGRQEGRPYPWSQQVIHEISGLSLRGKLFNHRHTDYHLGRQQPPLLLLWFVSRHLIESDRIQGR